ncbi:MAG: futalosine hydrolase [Prevotellaceae bacterium]|jgi:futalosine hydrolase|nr:futalosine hydrolase [Prevotellaceae bacterium]
MQHLITAATDMELAAVRNRLQCAGGVDFFVTGVGMMATACALSDLLAQKRYDVALNVGIAGTFTPRLALGQVALVERERVEGYGAENAAGDVHLFSGGEIICHFANDFPALQPYPKVSGLTVNLLTESPVRLAARKRLYSADVETMEGAAFFFACRRRQVKFLQLRGISNVVGVRDKSQWKTAEALENLATAVQRFLQEPVLCDAAGAVDDYTPLNLAR